KKPKKRTSEVNYELLSALSPDSLEEGEGYIRTGSNYTRTLVAVEFMPIIEQSQIQALSNISENVSVVQYISHIEESEIKRMLNQSIRQNRDKTNSRHISEDVKAKAEAELDSAYMTLDSIARMGDKMFMF